MPRGLTRDAVACASGLNWCSFILLLFATISSYWTWGYAYPPPGSGMVNGITVSLGPWVAASAWSTYPVPCNCANGICWSWCLVGTQSVMWGGIPPEAACDPNSRVYQTWSGPLGYCSFPNNTIPENVATAAPTPSGATGEDELGGNVPAGTTFNNPSEVTSIQALIIISTITVFFAAIAGCADAGASSGSKALGGSAAFCSLIAWVFCLAAYCLWTSIPYVQKIQSNPATVAIPIWVNQTGNLMTSIDVSDTWLGPGWATALTSSILIFFANVIHCVSLAGKDDSEDYSKPAEPIPAEATAVPPAASNPVPPAAQPSVVATV